MREKNLGYLGPLQDESVLLAKFALKWKAYPLRHRFSVVSFWRNPSQQWILYFPAFRPRVIEHQMALSMSQDCRHTGSLFCCAAVLGNSWRTEVSPSSEWAFFPLLCAFDITQRRSHPGPSSANPLLCYLRAPVGLQGQWSRQWNTNIKHENLWGMDWEALPKNWKEINISGRVWWQMFWLFWGLFLPEFSCQQPTNVGVWRHYPKKEIHLNLTNC